MLLFLIFVFPFLVSSFEIEEPEFFEIQLDRDHPEKIYKEFEEFKIKYNKTYKTPEENARRLQNYLQTAKKVGTLNQKAEDKKQATEFGINKFSDLSVTEFQQRLSHVRPNHSKLLKQFSLKTKRTKRQAEYDEEIPDNFDLRNERTNGKKIIGEVKDQGHCSCCWGFAVVAVVESVYAAHLGRFRSFSEQELCDCATDGTLGCRGGTLEWGVDHVIGKGLSTAVDYDYDEDRANKTGMCIADQMKRIFPPNRLDYVHIHPEDAEHEIMGVVFHWKTPVAVMFAVGSAFRNYVSGVLEEQDCNREGKEWHAGAIVGYGQTKNRYNRIQKYWIVRNSWGAMGRDAWGDAGYGKIIRGRNWCGIENNAVAGNLMGLIDRA